MINTAITIVAALLTVTACNNSDKKLSSKDFNKECSDKCCNDMDAKSEALTCKLTSPELQARKATIISSLRTQVKEKKELENGYAFKFNGSDKMVDELMEFAKSERQCCDFFTFNLTMTGDTSELWFEMTGPADAKEFIKAELEI